MNKYKVRLAELNKKNVDVLRELQKRGYKKLGAQALSSYFNGTVSGPQADAVCKMSDEIIRKWEQERKMAQ